MTDFASLQLQLWSRVWRRKQVSVIAGLYNLVSTGDSEAQTTVQDGVAYDQKSDELATLLEVLNLAAAAQEDSPNPYHQAVMRA
ncbi:hypothetical protein MBLNU459_g5097t1 [Dothideomycetes sp. NU459]